MEHLDFRFGPSAFRLLMPDGARQQQETQFLHHFPAWTLGGDDAASPPMAIHYPDVPAEPWLTNFLGGLQVAMGECGYAPFHGALIEAGDQLTIVCGESGAGKSFFSLSLAQRGRLLGDDLFFGKGTASTLEVVPLPRFAKSRSAFFAGVSRAPTPQESTLFALENVKLVFPRLALQSASTALNKSGEVFARLLKGNLYGDADQSLRNAKLQLDLRKRLSERCLAFDVAYRLADDPPAIYDMVSNLAIR